MPSSRRRSRSTATSRRSCCCTAGPSRSSSLFGAFFSARASRNSPYLLLIDRKTNVSVVYQLTPGPNTLHGAFSPDRPPILRLQPGDAVEASTVDAGWGMEQLHFDGSPRKKYPVPEAAEQQGHALIGPIWIEGAEPGKTLVVHIEEVIPGAFGFTISGGWPHRVHQALGFVDSGEELFLWDLDVERMVATDQHGHRVRMKPFLGVMGMTPPEPGFHYTDPPRVWGGNLDCRDLVAGTRLYLPIPVEGGLFSFGDGHAAQGHGEVSVTAIECPMQRVRLRFDLLDAPSVAPRAWTPAGWLTFGFSEDLEKATMQALDGMVDLMVAQYGLPSRKQALGLASAIVDLHITQIANPAMGVHAFLLHDALKV
ncbi:MAG: acetamidase/formamidase family protein [Chloroflexi bacterium]|nr:acetamidase/formamidase family protein [Chloroflexota bacterium]